MHGSWGTRNLALQTLSSDAPAVIEAFGELFGLVDECAYALMALGDPFGRCTALVTAKARNLSLACCGMALDGLAQEGGALLRPLIEADELLTYLRLDPTRVDEVLEERLPSAGVIAKRIEGDHKDLRDYLNSHASHLSVGPESMGHYLATTADTSVDLRVEQPFQVVTTLTNLQTLFAILSLVTIEAANCCYVGGSEQAGDVSNRINELKDRGMRVIAEAIAAAKA